MSDEWTEYEEPEIHARNLMLCRKIGYDSTQPRSPYTLHNVLTEFHLLSRPTAARREPAWVYVEYFGEAGDYEVWFDVVRFEWNEDGEVADEREVANIGPFLLRLESNKFVQGRSYYLPRLSLAVAGVHELRLSIAGVSQTLTALRFQVEE
jgi:hypothetical protein